MNDLLKYGVGFALGYIFFSCYKQGGLSALAPAGSSAAVLLPAPAVAALPAPVVATSTSPAAPVTSTMSGFGASYLSSLDSDHYHMQTG